MGSRVPVELADDHDATLADRNEGVAEFRPLAIRSGIAVIGSTFSGSTWSEWRTSR
jgi:hypothetical protein